MRWTLKPSLKDKLARVGRVKKLMASEVSAAGTKWRIFWFEIVSGTDRASLFPPVGKQLGSVIIERRRYGKFEYDFASFYLYFSTVSASSCPSVLSVLAPTGSLVCG